MVAWHLLLASSLPHFLAESSEAAGIPFEGGIRVLQHTQECPSTYCRLRGCFTRQDSMLPSLLPSLLGTDRAQEHACTHMYCIPT